MIYKEKIIESLRELSDEAFQRRVWLASSGPEISSLTEAVSGLFDDSGLGDMLDRHKRTPIFTNTIDDRLVRLRVTVEPILQLEKQLPMEAVIQHKAMAEVRRAAMEILTLIEKEYEV